MAKHSALANERPVTTADGEPPTRQVKYGAAIREALGQAMAEDPTTFIIGEDVETGGVFSITRGLSERCPGRVVNSPIAEASIVGLGVGAAAAGCRPIIDLMFNDFMTVAMDQIVNQAAKMKYMFGGSIKLPLTLLMAAGGGQSMAAQHSQSLEAWLCHVPGLKVVMPSGPFEAKGLLLAAVRDDNPVVFLFNKMSLGLTAPVPEDAYSISLGRASVVQAGGDATVIALGRMVGESLKARELLSTEGIDLEVVDPQTLSPLDTETLATSVMKTNRCIVAHEAVEFGGFGGEIASRVQLEAFDYLDAPIERVGAPFCPVPYSSALERLYLPDAAGIVTAVKRTLARSGD